jgi:hypothetical protein
MSVKAAVMVGSTLSIALAVLVITHSVTSSSHAYRSSDSA